MKTYPNGASGVPSLVWASLSMMERFDLIEVLRDGAPIRPWMRRHPGGLIDEDPELTDHGVEVAEYCEMQQRMMEQGMMDALNQEHRRKAGE